MAHFKKSALAIAVFTSIATAQAYASNHSSSSMSGLMNNSFFSDSSLTLHLTNYYRKTSEKFESRMPDPDTKTMTQKAWAQGVNLNFKSGWFYNWVGLDLSSYYSLKLSGEKGKSDVGLLKVNQNDDSKSESFGKVGYAVRLNLMDHGEIKYGRMTVDTPLFRSNDEFIVPTLYQGYFGHASWNNLMGYMGYFNKASDANMTRFDNLSAIDSKGKDKKQAVMVYGLQYSIDNLMLRATQTKQDDYAQYTYADATYKMPIKNMGNFGFGAQYGSNKAIGEGKNTLVNSDVDNEHGNKTSLNWWGVKFDWNKDNFSAGLSHVNIGSKSGATDKSSAWDMARMQVSTEGETDTAVGNDFIGYTAGLISGFDAPGTSSTRLDFGYDFSDFVKGLSTTVGYTGGTIKYNGADNRDVSEMDIAVKYDFPMVKGLSAEIQHGKYEAKWKASGVSMKDSGKDTRVMFNYQIAIF